MGVLPEELPGSFHWVRVEGEFLEENSICLLFFVTGALFVVNSDNGGFISNAEAYFTMLVPR